jgi:putative N6-adenine-specific DNA methylase
MTSPILVTCARGIGPFLQEEVKALGFPAVPVSESSLETRGTLADTMKLNLWLRTAHRVLLQIHQCAAADADALYAELRAFPWEDLLHADGYVCITSSVANPSIRDPRFANLRVKDAIVDRMQETCGRRPDSGPERQDAVIHLVWQGRIAKLYVDTSGDALNRRNYRKNPLQAPMMETLAAACVLASPWRGRGAFVNPMCGSGTLAIEAALIAAGIAPGSLRRNFGFMHVKSYREADWKALRPMPPSPHSPNLPRIIATDISAKAIEAARSNARNAGVENRIEFGVCDFRETPVPPGGGVVVFNPEYGERLGNEKALEPTYKAIGDFLKQKCGGYNGYVFTGHLGLAKKIGLRSSRRIILYNARIECRLLEFEMYAGSRDP